MASVPPKDACDFCEAILPEVSRSFALIIPKCPPPIDRSLCVGYLLCRVADTVEDEPALKSPLRNELYDRFLAVVDSPDASDLVRRFQDGWPAHTGGTPVPQGPYGRLMAGLADVMGGYRSLPEWCREPIRRCVHDMVAGMRISLPVEEQRGVAFYCRDLPGLDQYCHYVAGTVGIMSTALFEHHFTLNAAGRPEGAFAATPEWREDGRRMGLGLQMTNIIKDCRVDAERGASFIPSRYVDWSGGGYELSRPGLAELIRHAVGHLDAAMRYIAAIPAEQKGIRTFLLGSIFPAIATLEVAASGRQYHPKISRLKMGQIFAAIARNPANTARLNAWYERHREATLAQLG